jgi:hypothetical protein
MMSDLTERIQLTLEHRELLLKYAFPSTRLLNALRRWPKSQAVRRVWMSRAELQRQIGELSRSYNHNETGSDSDAVLELCDHLEYAERTGDGDLDIMW